MKGGLWVKTRRGVPTHSFGRWRSMVDRVRKGISHASTDCYEHVSISADFLNFQNFTKWHTMQVGYMLPNYHLDKDLIGSHLKEYAENTCVLIPSELNLFMRNSKIRKSASFQGVSFCKQRNKYVVGISHRNSTIYGGRFNSPEEARKKYCEIKDGLAQEWVLRLKNKEFLVDDKVIFALENWCTNDRS